MKRIREWMDQWLVTRFLFYFFFHFLFWIIVFEALYSIWPDEMEMAFVRNVMLAALLATILTILLHGVRILSGPKKPSG